MTSPQKQPENAPRRSWLPAGISLVFSAAAIEMMMLYGRVHEQLLLDASDAPQQAIVTILAHLGWLRVIFAVLAMLTTLQAFRTGPRWAAFIALTGTLAALMTLGIIL